jgi:hypothetical protein
MIDFFSRNVDNNFDASKLEITETVMNGIRIKRTCLGQRRIAEGYRDDDVIHEMLFYDNNRIQWEHFTYLKVGRGQVQEQTVTYRPDGTFETRDLLYVGGFREKCTYHSNGKLATLRMLNAQNAVTLKQDYDQDGLLIAHPLEVKSAATRPGLARRLIDRVLGQQ